MDVKSPYSTAQATQPVSSRHTAALVQWASPAALIEDAPNVTAWRLCAHGGAGPKFNNGRSVATEGWGYKVALESLGNQKRHANQAELR